MPRQGESWGRLDPLSDGHGIYWLSKQETIIGRSSKCDIQIKNRRLSSCHCIIRKKGQDIVIKDNSLNGTFLLETKIRQNQFSSIEDGSEFWLLPYHRVGKNDAIGFKVVLKDPNPESFEKKIKDQITCQFCWQIMSIPVTVQPCNHHFCATCLTTLIEKKVGKCIACRKTIITAARSPNFNDIIKRYMARHPQEKRHKDKELQVDKNNLFGSKIIQVSKILEEDYTEKQQKSIGGKGSANKESQLLNETEDFSEKQTNSELIKPISLGAQKKQQPALVRTTESVLRSEQESDRSKSRNRGRQRSRETQSKRGERRRQDKRQQKWQVSSDLSARSDDEQSKNIGKPNLKCKQCVTPRNGFKCPEDQLHVTCHNCSKVLPLRSAEYNQSCVICNSYFCCLYFPPCSKSGPKMQFLANRQSTLTFELQTFRGNQVEMENFKGLLIATRVKLVQVFNEMMDMAEKGKFIFIFDRRIINQASREKQVQLKRSSPVCDNCWKQLWFQMIFAYRKEHEDSLPPSIRERPVCYYGVNCRTMAHNLEHAKKFNHMVFQTRF